MPYILLVWSMRFRGCRRTIIINDYVDLNRRLSARITYVLSTYITASTQRVKEHPILSADIVVFWGRISVVMHASCEMSFEIMIVAVNLIADTSH